MKKTWHLFLFGGLLAALLICSATFDWRIQFVLSGLLYFIGFFFLARFKQDLRKWDFFIVLSPFLLLYGLATFLNLLKGQIQNIPTLIIPIIAAYLGFKFHRKFTIYKAGPLALFAFCGYIFMHNWLLFSFHEQNIDPYRFPDLAMIDKSGEDLEFDNNNVKVIDVWALSCANCIEKFPAFDTLRAEYSNKKAVKFYTLNLPERRNDWRDPSKFTQKFNFESLITQDMDSWDKLEIQATPYVFVLDKNQKIIYKGSLNNKWYDLYNNIHDIIKEAENSF